MGIVYEAEQQNPKRPVAIKVMRIEANASDYQILLFEREVHSLARLRHPGIAAIHDAGLTSDGRHYFAMELVSGITLKECLINRPKIGEGYRPELKWRLELFLQICDALSYAHQRGVIHRDLKPSNIMVVSKNGKNPPFGLSDPVAPKILDFGLAKIADTESTFGTVLSATGMIQGTLPYMSPEQAIGKPDEIGMQADVYSMGVLLYEIVTGKLPYDVSNVIIYEAIRVICNESPRKPSTYVSALKGDLETILLKALEKDPQRRYAGISSLAEDIRRFLDNQPILARRPSKIYQTRKLVARHKILFGSLTVLFLLLSGFGGTMATMFQAQRHERMRADSERDRATLEALKVEQMNTFFQQILTGSPASSGPNNQVTVQQALDRAAKAQVASLEGQPDLQAAVSTTIGRAYMTLEQYESAEQYLSGALETRTRTLGPDHPDIYRTRSELALLMNMKGQYAAAESLAKLALSSEEKVIGLHDPQLEGILNTIAMSLEGQGKNEEAEAVLRRVLDLQKGTSAEELGRSDEVRNRLITVLQKQGKVDQARQLNEVSARAEERSKSRLFSAGEKGAGKSSRAEVFYSRGMLLWQRGEFKAARGSLEMFLELAPTDPRGEKVRDLLLRLLPTEDARADSGYTVIRRGAVP